MVVLAAIGGAWAPAARAQCVGDCDGDGRVTVDEITRAVGVSLAVGLPDPVCAAIDRDGDGHIAVTELILAVNNALNGCPPP